MNRNDAITRIQNGLGFAERQFDTIVLRLQEAQRDLERGKTLPRFLLQEDQTFTVLAGEHSAPLPAGFLRVDDDNPPHFTPNPVSGPQFVQLKRSYKDTFRANFSSIRSGPKVAVIRNTSIDFIAPSDADYTFTWSYYKAGLLLDSPIENEWLAGAPEWLIGEAGYRLAMDNRDKDAVSLFQALMTKGRAACLGDIIADEESVGPQYMGMGL
jgi:hypothetical protein